MLIGSLGLYGLIRFMTVKRTKEVGIRKILGASVANIFVLFTMEFVLLVVLVLIVAARVAWYGLQLWLSGFVYNIGLSWWIFAGGGVLAMIIAVITVSFRTVSAANSDPIKSLRYE